VIRGLFSPNPQAIYGKARTTVESEVSPQKASIRTKM
jgi:hypothetical protein